MVIISGVPIFRIFMVNDDVHTEEMPYFKDFLMISYW